MSRRLHVIQQSLYGLAGSVNLTAPCTVDKGQLSVFMDLCRTLCFPQYLPVTQPGHLLNQIINILTEQLVCGFTLRDTYDSRFRYGPTSKDATVDDPPPPEPHLPLYFVRCRACTTQAEAFRIAAEHIVEEFVQCRLPKVKALLKLDVDALFEHDVAAESKCEVVLCYPGIACVLHQRIAHELYLLGAPNNVTRLLTEMAHSATGIDIHPHTSIGHHFFIDHGTGVVIGATAIIGNHVCIYQGVTLGARSFPVNPATGQRIKLLPRHPIIEDGVTIYSNAVVLGRITVGANATIAGNAWVTQSVPRNAVVLQTGARVVGKGTTAAASLFQSDGGGI